MLSAPLLARGIDVLCALVIEYGPYRSGAVIGLGIYDDQGTALLEEVAIEEDIVPGHTHVKRIFGRMTEGAADGCST